MSRLQNGKFDQLPRGLRIERGSYVAYLTHPVGPPTRRVAGRVGVITAKWAVQQRMIWQRQIAEGTYKKREVRPVVYKVADLFEPYMLDFVNRGGRDPQRWRGAWKHLEPHFASTAVGNVTTAQINEYIAKRKEAGKANGTINRELTLLRAMFRFGTRVTPPMVTVGPAFPTRLKEASPRQGFIGNSEYALLAANAKELWLRALIACAYAFGFRKGELLNLHVRQVDLLDRWLTLEEGTTKNDQGRKVRLTQETFELLKACARGKRADDYVFTREDGSHIVDPRKAWYALCVACGLGKLTPVKKGFQKYSGLNLHDFRRSAIRNMTRRGVNDVVAMKISGHKTASVFRRYNIVDERDLVRASQLIEAADPAVDRLVAETDTKTDTSRVAHS